MELVVLCYAAGCSQPATHKCRRPGCGHVFCCAHGDFLCTSCFEQLSRKDEAEARARARERLLRKSRPGSKV